MPSHLNHLYRLFWAGYSCRGAIEIIIQLKKRQKAFKSRALSLEAEADVRAEIISQLGHSY